MARNVVERRNGLWELLNRRSFECCFWRLRCRIVGFHRLEIICFLVEKGRRLLFLLRDNIEILGRIAFDEIVHHFLNRRLPGPVNMEVFKRSLETGGQHAYNFLVETFLHHDKLTVSASRTSNSLDKMMTDRVPNTKRKDTERFI